jgi:hypothetical protein
MHCSANRNGERDRLGRIGWRLANRIPRAEKWLRRDAATCGRDARAPRCANTDPHRACPPKPWRRWNSIFIPQSRDPADVLDPATSEIASCSKLGINATKKLPGEGFKRRWPPLIRMDGSASIKRQSVRLVFTSLLQPRRLEFKVATRHLPRHSRKRCFEQTATLRRELT